MADLCVSASLRNVGKNKCDVQLGAFAYFIPTARELTPAELATETALIAALRAGALLSRSAQNKVFILPKFSDVTDNTAEPSTETLGDGRTQTGVEPAPSYTNEYPMGFCQAQAIGAFNGYTGKGYIVDANGIFLFVNRADGGGKPFSVAEMFTSVPRVGAYTGKRVVTTRINFANVDEWRNASAVRISLGELTNIPAQEDVALYSAAAPVAYTFTVGGRIKCANTEIFDAYAVQLSDPANWKVTRLDTGATVTVSAVAQDAAAKGWDITLSSTPTIATGTPIRFELDLVAMQAEDILGLESIAVTINKPA